MIHWAWLLAAEIGGIFVGVALTIWAALAKFQKM